MKKNKNAVIYSAVLFVASFVYLVVYQLKLKDIVVNTLDMTYSFIKTFAVSPIFYFSMAFIVAALVLAWAKKPVAKKTKRLCIIGCVALEAAFVIVISLLVAKVSVPYLIFWFAIPHPWIHAVPGALLSIGAFKD